MHVSIHSKLFQGWLLSDFKLAERHEQQVARLQGSGYWRKGCHQKSLTSLVFHRGLTVGLSWRTMYLVLIIVQQVGTLFLSV